MGKVLKCTVMPKDTVFDCILSMQGSVFDNESLACRRDLIKWLVSTGEPLLDVTIWSL